MILVLRLISRYANWIYLFCAVGVVLCLGATRSAIRERDASLFTLERESATSKARRVLGLMVAFLLVAGATAFTDLSLIPRMDLSPQTSVRTPLPLPTSTNIIPPATPMPTPGQPSPTPTRPPRPTPTPAETPSPSPASPAPPPPPTCSNPGVQITAPRPGAQLEGAVEIWGTVDVADFWYYKVEFAVGANPAEGDWHWIGPEPEEARQGTANGCLVTWNTSGLSPEVYSLRLVAVDTTGNIPPDNICRLQVSI